MNKSAILARKFPNTTGIVLEGEAIIKWEVIEHPQIPTDTEISQWAYEVDFIEISATQFLRALSISGYRPVVDAHVTASRNNDLIDLFNRSTTFRSNNPMLLAAAAEIGLSNADVQSVFEIGRDII